MAGHCTCGTPALPQPSAEPSPSVISTSHDIPTFPGPLLSSKGGDLGAHTSPAGRLGMTGLLQHSHLYTNSVQQLFQSNQPV